MFMILNPSIWELNYTKDNQHSLVVLLFAKEEQNLSPAKMFAEENVKIVQVI